MPVPVCKAPNVTRCGDLSAFDFKGINASGTDEQEIDLRDALPDVLR
jgi:hypothetical protein